MKTLRSGALALALMLWAFTCTVNAQTATVPPGAGTQANPYLISTLDHLYWITQNPTEWVEGKYFLQTAPIDATSTASWDAGGGFFPIGNQITKFNGVYDGGGFDIQKLTINRTSAAYQALFGYLDSKATVKNLTMSAPSISAWSPSTGFDSYAGGMIGLNIGTVSNCHTRGGSVLGRQHVGGLVGTNHKIVEYSSSTANVSGDCWVGGVVGYSAQNCTLRYCYSSGSISAAASGARRFRIGGITGIVEGVNTKIEYCYSSASVTGKSHIGGAIGSVSSATIKHCYSRGSVSGASSEMGGFVGYIQSGAGFTQCFWDANTSGRSTSAGGTSRTTAQMKVTSNFTGWDFMCETANGTADIWVHRSAVNNGYPTGMGRRLFRHLQRLAGYKQQQLGTK